MALKYCSRSLLDHGVQRVEHVRVIVGPVKHDIVLHLEFFIHVLD